jgi:predicted deacylase
VKLNQTHHEEVPLSRAAPRLHKVTSNQHSRRTTLDTVVELAELVRDLHQSLESYAPMWYTEKMNDQIRNTLAAADWAYQALTDRRQA